MCIRDSSHSGEIIDLGADLGIIKKSGSWYSYNDTKLGQGRDAAKQWAAFTPFSVQKGDGSISLDGTWKFRWTPVPNERVVNFYQTNFNDKDLSLIHI